MSFLAQHLVILPILLPLVVGAAMVVLGEHRRWLKAWIGLGSTLALLVLAVLLLVRVDDQAGGWTAVYLLANWPAPFGIALAADRLAAVMLAVAALLAIASLVFATARWDRAGVHFHSLFQFLLVGVNGAVLTADLFNLFVFFEVMLAGSYGLVLYGGGTERVRTGLHYIVVNLAASSLFLIGVALIYAITGTLNMADIAGHVAGVAGDDRVLLEIGAAVLAVAFLIKAAMWPLNFWLSPAYSAASPPVAAVFAIMTKVGVYALLRMWLLFFGTDAGDSAGFGGAWLVYGGLATLAFGMLGLFASQNLAHLASFSLIVSSGTLLAAIALGGAPMTAAALYYLVISTLAVGAFFLLIELVERSRGQDADVRALTREMLEAEGVIGAVPETDEVGVTIPAATAFLGLSFLACALLLTGLPPLGGFLAKFALLSAVLSPATLDVAPVAGWVLLVLLIASGLAGLIALVRTGTRVFWATEDRAPPRLRLTETAPIAMLLLVTVGLTVQAGPVMGYLDRAAAELHAPGGYTRAVLSATPVSAPGPRAEVHR